MESESGQSLRKSELKLGLPLLESEAVLVLMQEGALGVVKGRGRVLFFAGGVV
jgi:hypothetical protein